jgi:hypothetical protein
MPARRILNTFGSYSVPVFHVDLFLILPHLSQTMNPTEFLAGCVFDDELGFESRADCLGARLNAILRNRPEDWLRELPRMFLPEWKEALSVLRKELKRTPSVGEAFAFLWDIKHRARPINRISATKD